MKCAFSWPKAVHEGDGTVQLFVTKNSDEEQRNSIISIFSVQFKGRPFTLFAGTIKFFLEPQYVDLMVNIDSKRNSFPIPGVIDVKSESFVNPVTGEEQDTRNTTSKGLYIEARRDWKTKVMRITTPCLNFDQSDENAFYSIIEYEGP